MLYRLFLFLGLILATSPLFAAEFEIELELSAANYQRHVARFAKQGYILTDVSVYPGKRSDQFAVIASKQSDAKARQAHHGLDSQQLEEKITQYASEGFQPVVISGTERAGKSRFAVIWQKTDQADHIVRHSLSDAQLQTALQELKQQGYAPIKLDGYTLKNQPVHAGIWMKQDKTAWEATCNIPLNEFPKTFDDFNSRGFRLLDLCGFAVDDKPFYHALWLKDLDSLWRVQFHLTPEEYQKTAKKMAADQYQLVNIDGYRIQNQTYFNTIWQPIETRPGFELPVWKTVDEIPVSGIFQEELLSLDNSIKAFLQEHHPPGAAVAVSYRGRLVYARGFGYADLELKQPVQPESQFRIASISKPITAVAIMKLIEQKKLILDAKVFDILNDYQTPLAEPDVDPRLKEITIRQLLNHTAGWDRSVSFDPMFRSVDFANQLGKAPPAETGDIIQIMLKQPLDFNPGQRYAYSNFGYCLLGRVIETVTGLPYHDYVQQEICSPLKMSQTQLGKTLLQYRKKNEVKYYSPRRGASVFSPKNQEPVPAPYGAWYLEAMDSHGGWVASATDLVRFATAFNLPDQCPVLKASTIAQMIERPAGLAGYDPDGKPKDTYYACGWMVRPIDTAGNTNNWHNGALPGTSTLLVRRLDRINWAILFNTRHGKDQKNLSSSIEGPMHQWINQIEHWPEKDQFKQD
tara:strand:+ start:22043 stop:24112 length:2070 start_codon:yes stop_codon:yes gene_type:complete